MGMAASQARLLSITSRMADNELRAQIINNAKMRLTDDSSAASEKYISALNKTQMMLSNYDLLGNEQYQELTFQNLTSYSAYNNQYGLINKSGELVVSDLDAAKYENALKAAEANSDTDALTEFLKSYGLEKTTTYFDNPEIDPDMETIYNGDVEYDDNGNRVSGLHYGYDLSKTSTEKMVYDRLVSEYNEADTAYTNAVIKNMKTFLNDYIPSGETLDYEAKYDEVLKYYTDNGTQPTIAQSQSSLNYISKLFSEFVRNGYINQKDSDGKNTEFYTKMQYYLNNYIKFNGTSSAIAAPTTITETDDGYNIANGLFTIKGTDGNYTVELGPNADQESTITLNGGITNQNGIYSFTYNESFTEEDGTVTTTTNTCTFMTEPLSATINYTADELETAQAIQTVYKYFMQNVISEMNRDKFADSAKAEQQAYYDAAKNLSMFIFGTDVGKEDYDKLTDMEWIINSGKATTNLDGNTTITLQQNIDGTYTDVEYKANFEAIIDIYLVDQMIEKYGMPKTTWIDKNNPDENADAKAQWYTNLFEKMQESGYQKIEKGLTTSAEWIQFALESGLLSMVQVDKNNLWTSTMYSNCSDITEDTVELEITRAEAEYKRETQKIQAKDKRYDLELKNIDTEHNSLQTEYDSIKSVIDKNVERNFKMFS